MTERLKELLHDEATGIEIPTPAVAATLSTARGMVRRRRLRSGLAGAAALAIVVGGGMAIASLTDSPARQRSAEPRSAAEAYPSTGAYAVGQEVFLGADGERIVDVGAEVRSLYYTSAGVVVRSGATPNTDAPDPSAYSLLAPDGRMLPLTHQPGGVVPATDPSAPHLAWVEPADAGWEVVVLDVATDKEVARVPLAGVFTWGGWSAPPLALVGDTAYVALDDATVAVNWRTGATVKAQALQGSSIPEVGGNAAVRESRNRIRVTDLTTGDDVLTVAKDEQTWPWVSLSPDGRIALVRTETLRVMAGNKRHVDGPTSTNEVRIGGIAVGEVPDDLAAMAEGRESTPVEGEGSPGAATGTQSGPSTTWVVHDLLSGESVEIDVDGAEFGWTPDGHLLRVAEGAISVCEPVPLRCGDSTPISGKGELRLGGNTYES